MSQIQKLIWDHCFVSRTSAVMAAWLDCMAIKHGEAPFPIGCLIYTVCITVCSACLTDTLRQIIFYRIIYYASLQSQKWFLWHFYWSVNIEGPWKLIWEHGKYKNDSLTAHNHFKTRNRSTVTAEVYLPLLSLPPPRIGSLPSPRWSVQGSRGEAESEWYTYYSLSPSILFSCWLTGPVWPNLGGKWL